MEPELRPEHELSHGQQVCNPNEATRPEVVLCSEGTQTKIFVDKEVNTDELDFVMEAPL